MRLAGTFGLDTADISTMGASVQDGARHAHESRTQAERGDLLEAIAPSAFPTEGLVVP